MTYSHIIEKLKDILSKELGNKKILDKDIAKALEIDYGRFRQQKYRDIFIPYPEIMQFLAKRNISINWFFFNQLPETLIDATSNFIILKYQKTITATAGAGGINYEINPSPIVIDKQLLDHINSSYKYTEILQVFGDSMEPDIKEGSLIFVDRSKVDIDNNNNSIYAINTLDGVLIKRIRVYYNKYYLCSANKEYQDIEVSEFDIIGRVKGVLVNV